MATVEPLERDFVRLEASVPVDGDVSALLTGDAGRWLEGAERLPDVDGLRRYAVDLRLRVGGEEASLTTFRKAALLDLGPVRQTGPRFECQVSWRAATAAPLFPVFSGWLSAGPGDIRIDGLYSPPGGVVGRIADRVLLHTAANATARWLLHQLARAASAR